MNQVCHSSKPNENKLNNRQNLLAIQRKCGCGEKPKAAGACKKCEKEKLAGTFPGIQKNQSSNLYNPVQRSSSELMSSINSGKNISIDKSGGNEMPAEIRDRSERVFGTKLDAVRFHTDQKAQSLAAQLESRAFATGNHVYFGPGYFQPQSTEGLKLIGHELTHVIQQKNGLSSSKFTGDGDVYEQEADIAGDAFAKNKTVIIANSNGSIRDVQRSSDPGKEAEEGATEDTFEGFPYLGTASTESELSALVDELSSEEGGERIALVTQEVVSDKRSEQKSTAPKPEALLQSALIDEPIQRAVVAGCSVPGVPANLIGVAAHMQIGASCISNAPGCAGGGHPGFYIPGQIIRPDMVRQYPMGPMLDEVGEIKPGSWLGLGKQALAQAQVAAGIAAYTTAITPATSMWSYTHAPAPFILNPSQVLKAWGPSMGVYYYSCTGGRRVRVRRPIRVPVTRPVPVPSIPRVTVTPRQVAGGVAAVGIGYLIYRGIRMIPSLAPPLWWTIPVNAVAP